MYETPQQWILPAANPCFCFPIVIFLSWRPWMKRNVLYNSNLETPKRNPNMYLIAHDHVVETTILWIRKWHQYGADSELREFLEYKAV